MSLTHWASGMFRYKIAAVIADIPKHQCAPSSLSAPVALLPYEYAGGFNALNSSLARGCSYAHSTNVFGREPGTRRVAATEQSEVDGG